VCMNRIDVRLLSIPLIDNDLEWKSGSQVKLLRDGEKISSPDSNGFIQMQTLATYNVRTRMTLSSHTVFRLLDS
jgi:hypothetical protein